MADITGLFTYVQGNPRTPEELVKFDKCRRMIERRLNAIGGNTARRFTPFVVWMRQVIAENAPELLHDTIALSEDDEKHFACSARKPSQLSTLDPSKILKESVGGKSAGNG
ncbi:MAG: hypothetical protein ACXADX_15750 [Candidatus Hodarchaeales archaeon]